MNHDFTVVRLTNEQADVAIDVLSDAFFDYPVMTFSIGMAGPQYNPVLRLMVDVFTMSRFLRDYPVLGVKNTRDELLAVAAVNPPRGLPFPPELEHRYNKLYDALGPDGTARLEQLSDVWKKLEFQEPHYHLGMLGVAKKHQGEGHGRRLLEAVQAMSETDPESAGVGLSTEDPSNVPFYQRNGYQIIGHERLTNIETWLFFRADQ